MDQLTIYFDYNFGKIIPNALRKLRPPVHVKWHLNQGWPQEMPDDEWLEKVGQKGWIVITQDIKFHLIEHEIAAIQQHKVRCFYLPTANDGKWDTMCFFLKHHGKLFELAQRKPDPFIYSLKKNGVLRKVFDSAEE